MPGRPSGAKDSHKRASRQQKTASEYLKLAQIAEARESKEKEERDKARNTFFTKYSNSNSNSNSIQV